MPASLNATPSGERTHIGLFGCRNAGKSSLINAITGQDLAIVSDYKGTTTDPVSKAMEILPLGPVLLTDTPGMDDDTDLGQSRIEKARLVLRSTDIALLVVDAATGMNDFDRKLLQEIRDRKIPYLVVFNKCDLVPSFTLPEDLKDHSMLVSAQAGTRIWELKKRISQAQGKEEVKKPLLLDLLEPNALVVLVVPCDESAPKGRLILPQQQTIRELLDGHCSALVVQPQELPAMIRLLGQKISLVVTDSQAFHTVSQMVPPEIRLTSFSILFARYKGQLAPFLEGALKLKEISYIHAEGYPAAEMKHGPIALIDEEMPVVVIAPRRGHYDKILSNIQEVKARKGKVISIVTEGDSSVKALSDYAFEIPDTEECLVPILSVIPLQLLAYHIAIAKGRDVDQPRNLAKSVTVE